MPLTAKGQKIMAAMKEQYGSKKGESVFYASKNKGNISGVDEEAGGEVLYNKSGHVSGYKVGSEDQAESYGRPAASTPVGTPPSSSRESPVPARDRLPTARQFRKQFRDAVRAGLPLLQCLDLGTTWTGTNSSSKGFKDRAAFRQAVRDAMAKGISCDRALRIAVDLDPVESMTSATSPSTTAGTASTPTAGTSSTPMSGTTSAQSAYDERLRRRIHFRSSMRDALKAGRGFKDAISHSLGSMK